MGSPGLERGDRIQGKEGLLRGLPSLKITSPRQTRARPFGQSCAKACVPAGPSTFHGLPKCLYALYVKSWICADLLLHGQ